MSASTVPRDQQVTPLRLEVDIAFGPLSDAVDAASNVLEAFGELAGDPNAQAAIIGPKLRETYKEVNERVLALVRGHEVQTAAESPGEGDMMEGVLVELQGKLECVSLSLRDIVFAQPGDARLVDFHRTLLGAASIIEDAMKSTLDEFEWRVGRSSASTESEEASDA